MKLSSGFDSPKELIGYCSIHCETPRALFNGRQINDMIMLAGYPDDFPREVDPNLWISAKQPMQDLCDLALKR